jgi:hypothetical protein
MLLVRHMVRTRKQGASIMRHFQKSLLRTTAAVVAVVGWVALPTGAKASLVGDTITVFSQANIPVDTWTDSVLVGAGVELAGGDGSDHASAVGGNNFAALFPGDFIDVGASSITINYAALGGFGFPYAFITDFSDLDWTDTPGTLQNVTLAASATGLTAFNISMITPNSFQFQGTVDLVNGANFTLDLTANHDGVQVPESATLPLFAAGLMGLMHCLRRRRKVWTGVGFHSARAGPRICGSSS